MYYNLSELKLSFQKLSQCRNNITRMSKASLIALVLFLLIPMGPAWAAGVLTLTKDPVSGNTVKTGGLITYEIKPACNSNTGNCGTLNITDNLPAGVVLESCSLPPGYSAVGASCDPGSTALNIVKDATFQGGDTAVITIQVRVDLNADPAVDIVNATTAVISKPNAGTPASVTATAAAVDVLEPAADWVHVKDRITPPPSVEPTWDTDVLYTVQLCANNASGNVQLTGVSMVDNYPAGAVVVNAGGAVDDPVSHTLTWAIADADISFATLFPDPNLYETQQCIDRSYTLRYPSGTFSAGDAINNTVSSTSNEGYGPTPAEILENIVEPTPSVGHSKLANDVLKGTDLEWSINADNASSNAPVPAMVIYESLPVAPVDAPVGLAATTVTSGQWSSPPTTNAPGGSDVRARISYSQTPGVACSAATAVYTDLTGGAFIASPAASVSYNIPADTTCVRWEMRDYGVDGGGVAKDYQVPLGWSFTTPPLLTQDTSGVADADIDAKVRNCINSSYKLFDGTPFVDANYCAKANIENPASDVITAKYILPSTGNKPGDLIKIRMRFLHDQADSTGPIIDPVVADFLPPELEFVEVGYSSGNPLSGPTEGPMGYTNFLASAQPEPNYEVINDFAGTGKTLVRFSWSPTPSASALKLDGSPAVPNSASFAEGSLVDLVFTVRVKSGTPIGTYTNEMMFFDNAPRFTCNENEDGVEAQSQADPLDIDGNPATDKLCLSSATTAVISASVLDGSKWIKGDPTLSHIDVTNPSPANNAACPNENGGFTRYPCVAQTTKGGNFEYLIKLKNAGNEPLKDYVFYDVLPAIGDTGVGEPLSTSQRGTEWKAELTAAVVPANQQAIDALAQAGASIAYSTAANPCRPEVSSTTTETGWDLTCTDDWGPAPADLSTVTAFRIILPHGTTPWQINDELQFSVQMKAPLAAPGSNPTDVNDLHPAWNSFAHRVTQNSNNSRLPTAEPKQVGIIIPKGPKVSIGSVVWADLNNNGLQEASEAGIDGVTVSLLYADGTPASDQNGVLIPSQLTQNGGQYYFDNLDEGVYKVQITTPAGGYIPSTLQTTADDDDSLGDSNIAGPGVPADTYVSGKFTLSDNGEPEDVDETSLLPNNGDNADAIDDNNGNMTVDFGFYLPVSIGSIIWNDENNNGLQDAGELGIAGATVELLDGTGNLVAGVASQLTGVDGSYYFSGLTPGDYKVRVTMPAGYTKSTNQTVADNDNTANDSNIATSVGNVHTSGLFTLTAKGETTAAEETGGLVIGGVNSDDADNAAEDSGNMTVDFGFYPSKVSIGSIIWNDINNNGLQDSGELGIPGATVELLDGTGNLVAGVASQLTGVDGSYYFSGLAEGDYKVRVTMPAGYTKSTNQTVADNDNTANDSNIATSVGNIHTSGLFTLTANSETTAADETGGLVIGGVNSDDADNADSETENSGNMTVDFGFYQPVSIGSIIWNDENNNGLQDAGELGIPGATVELLDGTGNPVAGVASQLTGVDGSYYFSGLTPGDYKVRVTMPAGYTKSTNQTVADNDNTANDSNIATSVGNVHTSGLFTLTANGETTAAEETGGLVIGGVNSDDADNAAEDSGNMTVDFGFFKAVANAVSIGSVVWNDTNNDGIQDSNEDGLPGAVVTLINASGSNAGKPVIGYAPITTGADGLYYFGNLPEGDYQVQVVAPNGFSPSAVQEVNADGNVDNDSNIDTANSIGNTHVSAVVTLSNNDEPLDANETGILGGEQQDAADDDNGNMTVDFGFFRLNPDAVSIGSLVWFDDNDNGKQDDGEQPLAGAIVKLLDGNGVRVSGITEAVTGADGLYLFDNLPAGNYRIEVTPPAGYEPSSIQNGASNDDTANDSNILSSIGGIHTSGTFALSVGGELIETGGLVVNGNSTDDADNAAETNGNMTVDFGFNQPIVNAVSIGSVLWNDTNMDGIQDIGEPTISGATVTLLDSNGTPIASVSPQQTGNDGQYYFGNLPEGSYRVRVTVPSTLNLVPTFVQVANADSDIDNDSNIASSNEIIDGSGNVTDIVYTSGIVQLTNNGEPTEATGLAGSDDADSADEDNGNMTVDFGFVSKALLGALSGNVSEDVDGDALVDNVLNPNDPNNIDKPIKGVTLQLYTAAGRPVLSPVTGQPVTTTTDDDGNYIFEGLIPASYQVREIQPGGFASVSDIDPLDPLNDIIGDGSPIVVLAGRIAPGNNFIEKYAPTAIPTLSEWSLILLMMMLGFVGIRQANLRGGVKF